MASKQIIELVNRLKKSGIQISFTKPRSKISLYIQENSTITNENGDNSLQRKHNCEKKPTVLKFV
jgi:hypothetical protein